MHVCPMVTGVVPHVGGPVAKGEPTVLIGGMPAARATDMCTCVGPPDPIAKGAATVLIGGLPAARMGDPTMHGGTIVIGCPTVLIGDVTPGGGAPPSGGAGAGGGGGSGGGGASTYAGGGENAYAGGGGAYAGGQSQAVIAATQYAARTPPPSPPLYQAGPLQPHDHDTTPKTWIGIVLNDFDGKPIPHQDFQVTLEGGQLLSGTTDKNGYCRFDEIDPDQGEVDFIQITDNGEIALDKQDEEAAARAEDSPAAPHGAPRPLSNDEVAVIAVVDHVPMPDEDDAEDDEDLDDVLT
jgi:uncharacterized Zn-binding protein involved in type VI secretion